MKTRILDFIDFEKVNTLLEGFNQSTGFVTAILDLDGNVLSKSGWRQMCTDFHRINPKTSKKCTISDTELAGKLAEGEKYHFYKCLNGLVDVAVPIVINGEHIANLFSGQFFFEEPDIPFFKKQAKKYGFDENKYLEALGKVPIVSQEKVKTAIDFLQSMTQMICEMTFQKLEQIESNKTIKESEEKFKAVFESANVGKSITLPTGEINVNQAYCDMLGYTREELKNKKWQDITPEDEIPAIQAFTNPLLTGEKDSVRFEKRYICKDGTYTWTDVSVSIQRDDNGKPLHFITTVIDINDRKKSEAAFYHMDRRNRMATEASGVGIWEWSLNTNRVKWDKQMFQIYGMVPTENGFVDYNDISALVVKEELREQESILQETIKQRVRSVREFHIKRRSDGQVRCIQAIDTVLTNENGDVQWLLGTNIDITERKQAELELARLLESEKTALTEANKAKEQLSQILDRIGDGFGSLDRDFNYIYVNEKLAQNVGRKREDLLGHNIWKVFPEAIGTAVYKAYLRAMEEQVTIDLEHFYPHFGRWFQHRFYPSPGGLSVFSKDITESKLAEEKIKEQSSLVRIAAEKAKLGGWNVDLKENRSYWSDEVASIHEMPFGYAPLVEDGINFYAPEWRERIIKVFTDCAVKGVGYDEEMEIITSTGRRVWVRTIGEAVRDGNGKIFKVQGAFQDISEKKMAEEKIREKDLQFRKLSANVPDLIFQFTRKPDGTYCVPVASEGIKNIFGCSPEDVIDDFTPIGKVIYPEDADRVIADIEYSAKHLTYFTCEFRVQIPGRPVQWIFSRSTPEKLPDGSITWYGFNADITQRKEIEDALRVSEGKFRKIYEEGPFGMSLVNSDFKFIMVNRTFCAITGYTESELKELTFRDISYPDDKDIGIESVKKLIKGEIPVFKSEKRYVRKDGSVIWGAITVTANFDKNGIFLYNVSIVEDITGRKLAEEKIKTLNVRLQLLVEAIQELSTSTSMENIMKTVRTSGRKLVNADGTTFILRDGDSCYYADEDTVSPLWKGQHFPMNNCISGWAMLHKQTVTIVDIYADDRIPIESYQSTFVKSLAIAPIRLNDPLGAIGVYWGSNYSPSEIEIKLLNSLADAAAKAVENVQLIENLEKKVNERTSQLQVVNKELETFTYSVSHDLKAPLRGIDGYSKLLYDLYKPNLNKEAQYFIETIRSSTLQMNQLIDDLLSYSRLERSQLTRERIKIKDFVKSVLSIYNADLEVGNFKIIINIADVELIADPKGLTIALRNLIENALKFTRGRAEPSIQVEVEEKDLSWIISVNDNGIGFDMQYHQKIFEIFQRLQRVEDFPGTGIGLAMVSKAMHRMQGRVWAESTPGMGSTFYLEIPKNQ